MEKFDLYEKEINCNQVYDALSLSINDIKRLVNEYSGESYKKTFGRPTYLNGNPSFGNYKDATWEFIDWYNSIEFTPEKTKAVLKFMLKEFDKNLCHFCEEVDLSSNFGVMTHNTQQNILEAIKIKKILKDELKNMELLDG